MAFRKTKGRGVFAQPTGTPDLSGYKSLADSYNSIADVVFNIGTDIRTEKLNDLIIEAEKEGATAGSTYDAKGNLVPLTDLSINKNIESQVIGRREKKELKKAYTDSAIKTYTSNISNEAYLAAQDLLSNNPNDPQAIRGGLSGFIDGLENIPENVRQAVLPSITRHFVTAESQANAGMIALSRKDTEATMLENIRLTQESLNALSSKGESTNPGFAKGQAQMRQELMDDLEGSFEVLRSIDYTESQIDALKSAITISQVTSASQAHVARSLIANGYSQTLQMIEDTRKSFRDDPNIDGAIIYNSMVQELNRLQDINDANEKEISETRALNYAKALNAIELRDLNTEEEIFAIDLSTSQQTTAIQALRNRLAGQKTTEQQRLKAIQDSYNNQFDILMIPFKNEFSSRDERDENSNLIEMMWKMGQIGPLKYSQYQTKVNEFFVREMKSTADVENAYLERQMSKYTITPEALEAITPTLIEKGFVGTTDFATYTRQGWEKRIDTYRDDLAKQKDTVNEIIEARNAIVSGTANTTQINLVASQDVFSLIKDDVGQDLFSQNQEIQEENFNRVAVFTSQYGVVHPEAVKSLQGLENPTISEEVFQSKLQLYFKLRNTLSRAISAGGVTDLGMGDLYAESILRKQGISPLDYETAANLGMTKFQDIVESDTTNPNRRLVGVDASSLIEEYFTNAVAKEDLKSFLTRVLFGKKDPEERENKIIDNMFDAAPDLKGDHSDVVIGDDRLLRAMELSLANKIALNKVNPKDEKSIRIGIRDSLIEISNDVGINVDSEGNGTFGFSPWYSQASIEIGDVPLGMTTSEAVFEDIKFRLLRPDSALPNELKELIESEDGIISLEANSGYGPNQTYTVQIENADTGRKYNVLANYKFDFSSSHLNEVYNLALTRVQNKTIRTFLDNFAFMKKGVTKRRIRAIVGDLNDDANWFAFDQKENRFVALMELLQSMNSNLNPFADIDADKKFDARDVALLRDFLAGKLKEQEYKEEINKIYGK